MTHYPAPDQLIGLGEVGVTGDGTELAIVSFGNGHYLSHQALPALAAAGIKTRLIDMRWLSPLPADALIAATEGCRNVLIVDETRQSGGVAEALMALFTERSPARVARVTAADSFIATGPAYAVTMPSCESIIMAAKTLVLK
jgi:2-oxoisovalerate dehydrogenase E1 component